MMFPLAGSFVLSLPTFTPPNISTESHCCGRMTVRAACSVPSAFLHATPHTGAPCGWGHSATQLLWTQFGASYRLIAGAN